MSPVIGSENDCDVVPAPSAVPAAAGARVPNESLHVPGLVSAYRNHAVVAAPFGFAEPFNVADVVAKLDADCVVTLGCVAGVENDRMEPNDVP